MNDPRELIPIAQRPGNKPTEIGLWRGLIIGPVPPTIADYCWVNLPDVSSDNVFGPCRWEPRIQEVNTNVAESPEAAHNIPIGRILLPKLGDIALVAFDNQRFPWIVRWWPT